MILLDSIWMTGFRKFFVQSLKGKHRMILRRVNCNSPNPFFKIDLVIYVFYSWGLKQKWFRKRSFLPKTENSKLNLLVLTVSRSEIYEFHNFSWYPLLYNWRVIINLGHLKEVKKLKFVWEKKKNLTQSESRGSDLTSPR